MTTLALRIADSVLALFWLWILLQSLLSARLAGRDGFRRNRSERPRQYWFGIFVLALMVVHFGGLAIVGQKF
jgi:hypothetical protein